MTAVVPDPTSLPEHEIDLITNLGYVVHNVAAENKRLAATRDELLPLLMSGKVRVRDAERVVEEAT